MNFVKKLILLSFLFVIGGVFSPVFAQTATTSATNTDLSAELATEISTGSGTVQVIRNGDTVYLGTQLEDDANDSSQVPSRPKTRNTQSGVILSFIGSEIVIPKGFALSMAILINGVLSFVMVIASLLVLLYLIWGGIDWITSGGDKGKIENARRKIIAAVIGLIVVASSFAIMLLAIRFLGFSDLSDIFNSVQTLDS